MAVLHFRKVTKDLPNYLISRQYYKTYMPSMLLYYDHQLVTYKSISICYFIKNKPR